MDTNYYTEDGHYMDIEDLIQFVRFKVQELRDQNKPNDDEIIEFDDNQKWQELANIIIESNKET